MEVPGGYALEEKDEFASEVERRMWRSFWRYALEQQARKKDGVKCAQIEAPATKFVEGKIYRLVLEHDGGLRIDASDIPPILRGEKIRGPQAR
ncbi:MAG: hypothetical protein D6806_03355 [Deltaproteobacteria bacterium]|nr:MAG: hypothetical protein D6806_03355 [Deltaproteobacteria bacterium]